MGRQETFYELIRRQGISRRNFLKFCSLSAASLGLAPHFAGKIAHAMETKPRVPVIWLHGLECTCCTESFIRSAHPLAKDVILSLISLDYDDTIMAAAGHQAEQIIEDVMRDYKGQYILAVEGNPPLGNDGTFCIPGGRPFVEKLKEVSKDAAAVIAWGSCASWGCVQAAKPNPTTAVPIHKVITDKPIVKVPGCPPIAEVMTGVITYYVTFGKLPELDRQGRPLMFYGQRVHDKCYRRGPTTKARARATACTRWVAAGRQRTTPAPRRAGMKACRSRSRRVTAALAVPNRTSGITDRSTSGSRRSRSLAPKPMPTGWDSRLQQSSASASRRTRASRPCARPR
jgi:NiFe hydrogenase small subunit HydA